MHPSSLIAVLLFGISACSTPASDRSTEPIAPYDPVAEVDLFLATGGIGAAVTSVTPAASRPNGMSLVGPDTRTEASALSFYHCAGYHYDDDHIIGFSHTHAHGMGVTDYGGIQLMPRARWEEDLSDPRGRMAPFSHEAEWAEPGWYAVELQDDGTRVEIVATDHGAHHRFEFAPDAEPVVVFDLGYALGEDEIAEARFEADVPDAEVQLYQLLQGSYSGRYGGAMHHAVGRFDPAPVAAGSWIDPEDPEPGLHEASGPQAGGWVRFAPGTERVELRIALSFVDQDGARANLEAELPPADLESRREEARAAWAEPLGNLRVRGSTAEERVRLHTAHYHSLLMPSLHSDVDGRYRGLDGQVHTADFRYYSDLSLWDTFRTLHPWYVLVHPSLQLDILRSLVAMVEDGGSLPRWPLAHGYTGGMVGSPATQVMAGSYARGLDEGWSVHTGFEAALAAASGPTEDASRSAIESYLELGYVPTDASGAAASRTLEYAWSDHALAGWADALGEPSGQLWEQSESWKKLWDPAQGFFVGRDSSGEFQPLGSLNAWDEVYTEGNAWHYRYGVPQDVEGMIEVQAGGDRQAWLEELRRFWFDMVDTEPDDLLPDDAYWHGNEPVLHYAFLPALAGDPATTAAASRWVLEHRYGHDPATGLDGNDDSGTLSAWYLFASIGLYPLAGTDLYALGSPLFSRIEIDRPDGTVVIRAPGSGPAATIPWEIRSGDRPLEGSIRHDQLLAEELLFVYP